MTAATSAESVRARLAGEPVRLRCHGNRHSGTVELHVLRLGRPMLLDLEPSNALDLILELTAAHAAVTRRRAA